MAHWSPIEWLTLAGLILTVVVAISGVVGKIIGIQHKMLIKFLEEKFGSHHERITRLEEWKDVQAEDITGIKEKVAGLEGVIGMRGSLRNVSHIP